MYAYITKSYCNFRWCAADNDMIKESKDSTINIEYPVFLNK
jgi:hypothetical protein